MFLYIHIHTYIIYIHIHIHTGSPMFPQMPVSETAHANYGKGPKGEEDFMTRYLKDLKFCVRYLCHIG
jgi:hypothetical protein